jgi:hypothetical protein
MAALEHEIVSPREPHPPLKGCRVLIEEPSHDIRHLLAVVLEQLGCRTVGSTPEDAIRPRRLDLIVVEPAATAGRRLLEVHANLGSTVPVICVSIFPRERVSLPLTPSAYLLKPFATSDLQAAVLAALDSPS